MKMSKSNFWLYEMVKQFQNWVNLISSVHCHFYFAIYAQWGRHMWRGVFADDSVLVAEEEDRAVQQTAKNATHSQDV